MSRRTDVDLVRCQVLAAVDPDRWEDSATVVSRTWIDRMNTEARNGGSDRDVVRVHPDAEQARPQAITFPTKPDAVRWMTGHHR